MNIVEFNKAAKAILNEDAGSEGMSYVIEAKSGLKAVDTGVLKIDEVKSENGVSTANVSFVYAHDYGSAVQAIKEELKDIEITALKLVY